jgi:peptidoglycan-N-acetylmuramic acid deacetylase
MKRSDLKKICRPAGRLLLLVLAWALGTGAAFLKEHFTEKEAALSAASASASAGTGWGLKFHEDGQRPDGNSAMEELAAYDAFYAQDTEEKVIYLTFDCGYENGNTEPILDTLKKHGAPAAFFVVGTYIESEPELVRRMADEGHIVGNHTWHHPDLTQLDVGSLEEELTDVEDAYREATGRDMQKYLRPPQGRYSSDSLQRTKDLGYKTIFWSLTYEDWNQNAQPARENALDILTRRIHPGAIVLLHNTSCTNAAVLDELLARWEEMDYDFRPLTELQ